MRREKESRILQAATAVFLRYGYRRTTMGDIATAAGVSRPALYLLFCNKERVFEAALRRLGSGLLEEIRVALAPPGPPLAKLKLAFELWAVRPFSMLAESPDAQDLVHCSYEFAKEAMAQSQTAFEAQLVAVLATLPQGRIAPGSSLEQIAHLLSTAVHGFKGTARSASELRDMIEGLLHLTVTSLAPEGKLEQIP